MSNYRKIEKKWQKYWDEHHTFQAKEDSSLPKKYNLIEFPYPSGSGMHIGHIKAFLGQDVRSRMQRMQGYNVLFPIGYDAFGLPAENYAIQVGKHPREITDQNIETFRRQLKDVGFSFDFSREIDTTDPKYYKWTQWIFKKLFDHGLAYKDRTYVNYCPTCKVVLSNEDSQGGKCDRCDSDVIQKEKDVWFLKITDYAEQLLEGLDTVEYPDRVRLSQENWIGKSTGAFVHFKIKGIDESIKVYTTRPDTLFGATFMVIAPEHHLIDDYKDQIKNMNDILEYRKKANKKTEFERTQLVKDKTGVCIDGIVAINPVNNEELPIYIADYVMMGYGTGAIMAVPAHDDRDYEFAKKFNIPIIEVIKGGDISKEAYAGDGEMMNSGFLNGIKTKAEAIQKMCNYLVENNIGEATTQYKMKDWAFNRQRYWGEPIPIVYCDQCGTVSLNEEDLPLILPVVEEFKPGEDGESPLANIESFVNCKCPKCGGSAKRETDTMPQWAGSSWYYLRYIDPQNDNEICSKEKMKYWMNVDVYNGGAEHITRHMIYSRFWHHFLYDIGVVNTKEPYAKRTTTGLILGSDGSKMSKSKGNTVNPDDVVREHGADVLRGYILFMSDYGEEAPWNDHGVTGISRFINRVIKLGDKLNENNGYTKEVESLIHKTIKKVSEDIENIKYNTAISTLMILLNEFEKLDTVSKEDYRVLLQLLNPICPHITEELNDQYHLGEVICESSWPKYDEAMLVEETKKIAVQVNGKVRGTIVINISDSEDIIKEKALACDNVNKNTEGKKIVKIIIIQGKIVNIVIK